MSLRSEAVEAIARQVHAQQIENTNFPIAWENCAHIYRVASRLKAESVLDVLLDFLGAHTEEWDEAASADGYWANEIGGAIAEIILPVAVAALRGTTGKPGEI